MRWLCWFFPCQWVYLHRGLYQCVRCKTLSVGANRDNDRDLH
jgi:hypothetical protein